MEKKQPDAAKSLEHQRNEAWRSAQYFAMLIGAIALFNGILYWERGSKLALGICILSSIALVGWLVYSRKVVRGLS